MILCLFISSSKNDIDLNKVLNSFFDFPLKFFENLQKSISSREFILMLALCLYGLATQGSDPCSVNDCSVQTAAAGRCTQTAALHTTALSSRIFLMSDSKLRLASARCIFFPRPGQLSPLVSVCSNSHISLQHGAAWSHEICSRVWLSLTICLSRPSGLHMKQIKFNLLSSPGPKFFVPKPPRPNPTQSNPV